jgi:recombination protein RecA
MVGVSRLRDVFVADLLVQQRAERVAGFDLGEIAGRLSELTGAGALTIAVGLVREAQRAAEPVAWIVVGGDGPNPPDVAAAGVDLAALPFLRVDQPMQALAAANRLARSGAFGLLVVDLSRCGSVDGHRLPTRTLSRLVALSQKHSMGVLFLTSKAADQPSLDSLVSLRADVVRRVEGDRVTLRIEALKDKRRGPGWSDLRAFEGPPGFATPRIARLAVVSASDADFDSGSAPTPEIEPDPAPVLRLLPALDEPAVTSTGHGR